jgi:hypothetical protein
LPCIVAMAMRRPCRGCSAVIGAMGAGRSSVAAPFPGGKARLSSSAPPNSLP